MTVLVIGIGLIGGSMSLVLQKKGFTSCVIGVDINEQYLQQAKEKKIIHKAYPLDDLEQAMVNANLIVIATPVDKISDILIRLLDNIKTHQTVVEVGSTKSDTCNAVRNHKNRKQFVATHPMWGTEHSGPLHALEDAFNSKVCVFCDTLFSSKKAMSQVLHLYKVLGMHILYIEDPGVHDRDIAYVSHISHISSFALANTVLEKQKEQDKILQLASSGFESTVRLAKSSVSTWSPILLQNRKYIIDVLDEYIKQIEGFKTDLINNNQEGVNQKIIRSNEIKKILK